MDAGSPISLFALAAVVVGLSIGWAGKFKRGLTDAKLRDDRSEMQ